MPIVSKKPLDPGNHYEATFREVHCSLYSLIMETKSRAAFVLTKISLIRGLRIRSELSLDSTIVECIPTIPHSSGFYCAEIIDQVFAVVRIFPIAHRDAGIRTTL